MREHITIPDPVQETAERLAGTLGISLSDLYTAALTEYVAGHRDDGVTEALNQVYETEESAIEPALARAQYVLLKDEKW